MDLLGLKPIFTYKMTLSDRDPLIEQILERARQDPTFLHQLSSYLTADNELAIVADDLSLDSLFSPRGSSFFYLGSKVISPPYIIFKEGVTEQEYFEFATEDVSCELVNGLLVIHSPASADHENIFMFLSSLLHIFVTEKELGDVYGSHLVMRLQAGLDFEPDILFVPTDLLDHLQPTYLDSAVPFVVEILSSNRKYDLETKVPNYLTHGVEEIWIIDPIERQVIVFTQEQPTGQIYDNESVLSSSVLEGFSVSISWLWPDRKIKPLEACRRLLQS